MINFINNKIPAFNDLIKLYEDAGWTNYTSHPEMLIPAYEHSLAVISAWDNERLIGTIRVVGDGYSIIYIQDLLVIKEYQRRGIGSTLLKMVDMKYSSVYQKVLLTEDIPDTVGFYENCGFKKSNSFGCISFVKFT